MRLYFAHNFNERKKFREVELKIEEVLGIELLNPFYDDPARAEEMKELDARDADASVRIANLTANPFNRDEDRPEVIVQRDLVNLAKSDGLITIVEKPSFGTAIEICNAVLMRKPVYFIGEIYSMHPWIKVYATYTFKTVEDFINYFTNKKEK